jgi:hypothetical protein
MNWTEHTIARAIALQTLDRKCVVLVDNCNWTGHECDVLGVTTDLRIIDVEVKISRADLKADARKDKWWIRQWGHWLNGKMVQPDPVARLHPPKVWKHYYALPADIWKPELVDALPSRASGVLLLREPRNWREPAVVVECLRRATPSKDATRLKPEQVMDIARLANLRMWEAYHRQGQAEAERSHYYQQLRAMTGGLAA